MSRSAKTNSSGPKGASRSRRVLVGHQHHSSWHWVVLEAASPDGRKVRVLEADQGGVDVMERLTEKHRPDARLGVLASSEAVCRAVEVPEGHETELGEAAKLLAEAELPPSIPGHRRSGGIVPVMAGAGFRAALLLGWPLREGQSDQPPFSSWTSEIVGLAELLLIARAGGATGAQVIASVDRGRGCVGVVGSGTEGYAVRTVLEDASEPEAFAAAAERCIAGVAQKVQSTAVPRVGLSAGVLAIDPSIRSAIANTVAGTRDDDEWFRRYGSSLGVGASFLRATPATRGLFELYAQPPSVKRSLPERTLVAMRRPGVAGAVLVAGLACAMLIPIGVSAARISIAESRIASLNELLGSEPNAGEDGLTLDQQLAMYSELNRVRWPMAKLLADLSGALPAQSPNRLTLVRSIELRTQDRFRITGVSDTFDLINLAQQNLNGSNVFAGATIGRAQAVEGGSGLFEFEIDGWVTRPFFLAGQLPDYAEQNLAERIYEKEGAELWRAGAPIVSALNRTGSGSGSGARVAAASGSGRSQPAARPGGSSPGGAAGSSTGSSTAPGSSGSSAVASGAGGEARTDRREMFQGGSRSGGETEPGPVAEPLTDEQIAQMNQQEAMRETIARRRDAARSDIDDDTKRRLNEEITKLRDRARAAQGGG